MHRIHSGLTVAVVIQEGRSGDLQKVLQRINKRRPDETANFANSSTTLFVSGVILPADDYFGEPLPETFVFATSYCGTLSNHLTDILRTNRIYLSEMFKHCVGFPGGDVPEDRLFAYYLESHSYPGTFTSRYSCFSKEEIRREKKLRNEIEDYLDRGNRLNAFDNLTALQIKVLIQRHMRVQGQAFAWARKPIVYSIVEILSLARTLISRVVTVALPVLLFTYLVYRWLHRHFEFGLAQTFGIVTLALPILVGLLTVVSGYLFILNRSKNKPAAASSDDHMRRITATQLHPVLNEMTAAGPLKKGLVRKWFYANALTALQFVRFPLQVPTVSTIRWLVIDNGRRLVFFSNYCNTTDFYVRDFLNDATTSGAVNFMFSNGRGFPDAGLLYRKGIRSDPEGYMNAVHAGQYPTDLWYAHEPLLTQDVIHKHRKIRRGLYKKMDEDQAKEWLRLL